MTTAKEIGRLIRLAREEAGLSQEALGRELVPPRSHAAVSDFERGVTRLGVNELTQIARILNKPLSEFVSEWSQASAASSTLYARGDGGVSEEARSSIESFKAKARLAVQQAVKERRV